MWNDRFEDENVAEINIPSNIFAELELQPTEENEDGQIYYTILENDVENYSLDTDSELLSGNNILYLSLNNEETEVNETQDFKDNLKTEKDVSNDMEFVEKITLADGTEAYMTKVETNENEVNSEDVNLNEEPTIGSEEEDDIAIPEKTENVLSMQEYEDETKEPEYKQVQLDDGGIVLIEVGLYNSIIEQDAQSGQKITKCFQCPNEGCDKSYTTMHHLRVHMRNHYGLRPYRCSVEGCEKTFATGYSLKTHSRTHTGEKPYGCKSCHKSFKTSGDLQKHIRIHTGEKPFLCPVAGCGRSFTTSNIRKVHIRSHTGERPYQCTEPGCLKAFASATNYKNHIRIHSGEKPYACTVEGCGKRFTEYSSLYKHQMVHVNAKPCKCEYCGRICRQQSTLTIHKRLVHGVIVTDDGAELVLKMLDGSDAGTSEQSSSSQSPPTDKHIYIFSN